MKSKLAILRWPGACQIVEKAVTLNERNQMLNSKSLANGVGGVLYSSALLGVVLCISSVVGDVSAHGQACVSEKCKENVRELGKQKATEWYKDADGDGDVDNEEGEETAEEYEFNESFVIFNCLTDPSNCEQYTEAGRSLDETSWETSLTEMNLSELEKEGARRYKDGPPVPPVF